MNRGDRKRDDRRTLSRRRFLSMVTVGFGALGGLIVSVPFLGFLFAPLRRDEPERWRGIGALEDFPVGETTRVTFPDASSLPWAGVANEAGAWLQRRGAGEGEIVAYSIYCTHLGCPVLWQREARLFMCPCHGGIFYEDGEVASGPPREPLVQFPVRIRDGQVQIRTRSIEVTS